MGNSETQYREGDKQIKEYKMQRPKKAEVKFPAINSLALDFSGQRLHSLSLTWISAMRGEMTTVMPVASRAGSW